MNVQLVTNVAGNQEYIELFGTETLSLDVSFAEIQDITKKNSAYTKEFNVPGSNQNNYIFNYFFDFNQVPLDWIPSKKFEAWILYNGYIILSGYIRLNFVTIEKEQKIYNITFYNGVGDVAANIGDKFMKELDLSHLSHPWSNDIPYISQYDPNLINLTGSTNYSYENGKTFWGLFNIGYEYSNTISGAGYYDYYYFTGNTTVAITSTPKTIPASYRPPTVPSLVFSTSMYRVGDTIRLTQPSNDFFIQGIVTDISFGGSSITFRPTLGLGTGNLTSWFAQRILPDNEEINNFNTPLISFSPKPNNDADLLPVPSFFDGAAISPNAVKSFYPKPAIQIRELYEQIFIQNGYNIESNFFQTNYFEKYYLPLKFADTIYSKSAEVPCYTFQNTNIVLSASPIDLKILNPSSGVTCASNIFTATTTQLLYPSNNFGFMTWKVTWSYEPLLSCTLPGVKPYFYLGLDDGVNARQIFGFKTDVCVSGSNTFDITFQIPRNGVMEFKLVGWRTRFTSITMELINAPKYLEEGATFDYSNEFPIDEFKQIDFITSVNKMFNFVCVPHPTKQNTIIVEPIIDYIGKGEILDWTDKIDWNSPIQVSPTTSIINGTLNYNFKLDQDFVNQQYNIGNNRVFGTYQLQLDTEYKDNVTNFDTVFASPTDYVLPNGFIGKTPLTVPSLFSIKTKENNSQSILRQEPYKVLPRIIFRGTQFPNKNWNAFGDLSGSEWFYENYAMNTFQLCNRFNTYPFSLTGFSHYINFNSSNFYYPDELVFSGQQDMYDIYYYDYISDLTSNENKIVSAKIYLTPWEIGNLRFDEKIIIKNGYYRINKISNYNLSEPSLCDIELVKLTKSYTPHPVIYYDLSGCTGSTNYHSTSDLNYNLFAFAGRFVKLFSGVTELGCFSVSIGEPNYDYEYQKLTIGVGAPTQGNYLDPATDIDYSSRVQVFTDCGCTEYADFDIVQETYS